MKPVALTSTGAAYSPGVEESAAGKPISDVKDVLDPAIALTILMESAIY